jgi:hypothetical protein
MELKSIIKTPVHVFLLWSKVDKPAGLTCTILTKRRSYYYYKQLSFRLVFLSIKLSFRAQSVGMLTGAFPEPTCVEIILMAGMVLKCGSAR